MKLEMVVERYLFLASLWNEGYPDMDFEFSPSGFRNLERRFIDIWMIVNGYLFISVLWDRRKAQVGDSFL